MYSYMFEITPDSEETLPVIPNDATVLCGTPDGLLCEVIYEVIKPPRRMRKAIVRSAYGRRYKWDRHTYNEVFNNSIPVESEVYTI